ncbi:MAG: thiosulfate oxidation carrier complex protein SoxZ [Proteobacteria bacterium]|nr:thiosulfate oxidation carrier complex protein SoxZ [Pseudomonadota bacterium]
MSDPMRIRAVLSGDKIDVKILMAHVMETGQRKDAEGKLVPAHYTVKVSASCNGREVLDADWGPSVSKNPYLGFRFKGAAKGDKLKVTWTDTAGESRSDEAVIA